MICKKFLPAAVVLLLGLVPMQQALAAAGSLILSSGQVFILDARGVQRTAAVGATIESGETLLTRDGRAQIKFTDGGLISLQPSSEFKVTDYRFVAPGKSEEFAAFSLVKGGLRAITGLIGHRNKGDYRIVTAVATIGIRGTEFKAILCDKSCKEPDGLYVQTGIGIVVVSNAFGEVEIGRGATAYVPSAKEAPRRTSAAPTITAKPAVSEPPTVAGIGTGAEFQPGTIISSNNLGEITRLTSAGIGLATSGTGSITSISHGSWTGSGAGAGAGAGILSAADAALGIGGVYLLNGELRGAVVRLNDGQFASVILDRPTNAAANGSLYWGRWTDPSISLFASLSGFVQSETLKISGASIHYILGTTVPTIPTAGSATYSFAGGTPSTDQAGGIGSGITGGSITANFLGNTVGASVTVVHGGTHTIAASNLPFDGNRAGFSSNNGGIVSGVPAGSQLSGFFAGTNAPTAPSQAGVSYLINTASPIVGVGAFSCTSGC